MYLYPTLAKVVLESPLGNASIPPLGISREVLWESLRGFPLGIHKEIPLNVIKDSPLGNHKGYSFRVP